MMKEMVKQMVTIFQLCGRSSYENKNRLSCLPIDDFILFVEVWHVNTSISLFRVFGMSVFIYIWYLFGLYDVVWSFAIHRMHNLFIRIFDSDLQRMSVQTKYQTLKKKKFSKSKYRSGVTTWNWKRKKQQQSVTTVPEKKRQKKQQTSTHIHNSHMWSI